MRHLILTRLAVGNPSEEWLRSRIDLFEKFCAPSIAGQTCKDFVWLLAANYKTPGWFIERAKKTAPFAKLVYSASKTIYPDWNHLIRNEIIDNHLLTTRLDSDDGLNETFVEEVQKVAKTQTSTCILEAPLGYKLNLHTSACFEVRCENNHFISLLEYGTSQTVFCGNHLTMNTQFPVITFSEDKPLWLEVFHGGNVANREPRYGKPVNWDEIKKAFNAV